MARVELTGLTKRYGSAAAVDGVSLDIAEGELVALLGPSGCGKTTTLRMVAGFVEPDAGSIRIGGRDVTRLPPNRRDTGMVFQGYALFPHLTVAENVAFGLEMRRVGRSEIAARVEEALRLVRLAGLGSRYPRQLSGGQQQRVALARALVVRPAVFLLDEPLSNLDAKLRHEVRIEIRELQQRLGLTTIFVTHDQEEALTLADRLVLMSGGKVQQIGSPTELYEAPANLFVASFIGKANFLRGEMSSPGDFTSDGGLRLRCRVPERPLHRAVAALRPEKIALGADASPASANQVEVRVERVTYLGGLTEYEVRATTRETLVVHAVNGVGPPALAPGAQAIASWDAEAALLLEDTDGLNKGSVTGGGSE
jgi:putative spermidine/putrescine transport system ATP-binding protein